MLSIDQADRHVQFEIKPYLEYRLRVERRIDRDFASTTSDNRSDAFNRFRPGVEWKLGHHWSGEVQYQLAHDEYWKPGKDASEQASDLSLAYAKYKDPKVEVTIGRQKINIGTERLIGTLEWSPTARSYDGLRVKAGRWDAFGFKVGVALPRPVGVRIAGATYSSPYGLTSLIFKHDDPAGPMIDHWTLSHLWQGKWNKWSADCESAIQFGHSGGKELRAWAFHGGVGYAFNKTTKAYFEVNGASGGSNADTVFTFDNLLPTNHKFYGSMDMQSWRNMEEFAFGVDHTINPKCSVKASVHSFALRDPSDAWYSAGGAPNVGASGAFVDPTGASGRDIGREFDLEFTYKPTARITASAGVGLFFPGDFIKTRNGGQADRQLWGYVMLQVRF